MTPVKCVVWDLDGTLLDGVALERAAGTATPSAGMLDVLATLHERGVLHAVASRNPPEVAAAALAAVDWPCPFTATRFGWGAKSESVADIADELDVALASTAFVDDDPYERAEVAAALPAVTVLTPDEARSAPGWPAFIPPVVTAEGRDRAASYARTRERTAAQQEFAGDRAAFLRSVDTTVTLWPATAADLPRLHELSVRTTRFNSTGTVFGASPGTVEGRTIVCAALSDAFGDDGLVGAVVVTPDGTAELLMMSCRAMGRGVSETLLCGLADAARAAGTDTVRVPVRITDRNVPLRLALLAAGFRAGAVDDGRVVFTRSLAVPGPEQPGWVRLVQPS